MAGGTLTRINLMTSDRKQSSVAKLFMMKSAAVRIVSIGLDYTDCPGG
jgi:hypothetical protein